MSEGIFDRWSRRKLQRRDAEQPEAPVPPPERAPATEGPEAQAPQAPEAAPPTLAQAQALGIDSDFKPFVAEGLAPEVRNTAFRKLFADPHFNQMDGLDTYVDDYSRPSPLPDSVLRQMASAKFLQLFEEQPEETPGDAGLSDVAQSDDSPAPTSAPVAAAPPASQDTDDHHADLRLQPDDAAGAEDARRGAG